MKKWDWFKYLPHGSAIMAYQRIPWLVIKQMQKLIMCEKCNDMGKICESLTEWISQR